MSFTRWLYMNNQEKMKVLLYILPVLVAAYLIDLIIDQWFVASLLVGIVTTIVVAGYKNKYYINIIASKYDRDIKTDFKAALIQSLGAVIVNSLFGLLLVVIVGSLWLVSIATVMMPIALIALVATIASLIGYATLTKLGFLVILDNIANEQLQLTDFFNNFVDVYKDQFKPVLKVTVKALAYSFVLVVLLSFFSIYAVEIDSKPLILVSSLVIGFVIYWIDITVIQYLIREYTK